MNILKKYIEKAQILVDALPFFKRFHGKTFVIKYGGSTMNDPALKASLIEDIVLLKTVGINPVIVHGGGPEIKEMLDRLGIESRFVNGLRVTKKETMELFNAWENLIKAYEKFELKGI